MPRADDYLVLKPKHSIFYATPLDVLLTYMKVHTLVLTGLTGTQCILFSAMDAYVRDFKVYAPRDCIVSPNAKEAEVSDYVLRSSMNADTETSTQLRIAELKRPPHT